MSLTLVSLRSLFSRFYDAIGAGRTYADAFKFGCSNINLNNIPDNLIPVINIRNPSKSLFPPHSKENKASMSGNGRTINMGSGNYNEKIQGNYVQGNYYAGGEKQSLVDAAAEIQKLLEQLDKSYPNNTTAGKMAIATEAIEYIDSNQTLAQRVLSALKAGGVQALAHTQQFPTNPFHFPVLLVHLSN